MLRSRLWLPAAEAMHLAHVLVQTITGLVTGASRQTQRKDRSWRNHLLSSKDESNLPTVVNYFARLEFQDGKRKR
eukprot:6114708-Amphidinium_carterae.1